MKNKGFTLVEMLVSFSIASIVMVLLLNILLILKNLYIEDGMKTNLLIHQSNFQKRIEDSLASTQLVEINSCGDACLHFIFLDGTTQTLSYEEEKNALLFGNYKEELVKGAKVGAVTVENQTVPAITSLSHNNAVLSIEIPITHTLVEGDFGIYLVYPYNTNVTVINVT